MIIRAFHCVIMQSVLTHTLSCVINSPNTCFPIFHHIVGFLRLCNCSFCLLFVSYVTVNIRCLVGAVNVVLRVQDGSGEWMLEKILLCEGPVYPSSDREVAVRKSPGGNAVILPLFTLSP